jgi:hypothetical protein
MKLFALFVTSSLLFAGCSRGRQDQTKVEELTKRVEMAEGSIVALRDNQARLHTLSNRVAILERELYCTTNVYSEVFSILLSSCTNSENRLNQLESFRNLDQNLVDLKITSALSKHSREAPTPVATRNDSADKIALRLDMLRDSLDSMDMHQRDAEFQREMEESRRRTDRILNGR